MWSALPVAKKIQTGVTLEAEVIEYLDTIAAREERTRSQVINRIVKEHAARNGTPINGDKKPADKR